MDRPRVLVLDPDQESQTLFERVLGRHCDLIVQADPLYLFDALEAFEPDLIVTELDLPHLTGFELINLLQAEAASRAIPIMVYSARHEVEDQKLAYRLGAIHFQSKPARPSQLFKGAAMFVRLLSHPRAPKARPMEEVWRLLEERRREHRVHPLLEPMMRAERHHHDHPAPLPERSILAQVAGRRTSAR